MCNLIEMEKRKIKSETWKNRGIGLLAKVTTAAIAIEIIDVICKKINKNDKSAEYYSADEDSEISDLEDLENMLNLLQEE